MSSPTQRALKVLRDDGYHPAIVEKFVLHPKPRRVDMYGVGDVFAFKPGCRPVMIQACAAASHAARVKKCKAWKLLDEWNKVGILEVWSFRKVKAKRGGKRMVWKLRREAIR